MGWGWDGVADSSAWGGVSPPLVSGLSPLSLPSLTLSLYSVIVDEVLEGGPGAGRYPLGGGEGTISALHGRLGRGCGPELTLIAK